MRTRIRNQQEDNANLETTVSDEMDLSVNPAAVGLDKLVGVAGVTVHVVVTIRGTAIGE